MIYLLLEIESASYCKKKTVKLQMELYSRYENNDLKTHHLTLQECAASFFCRAISLIIWPKLSVYVVYQILLLSLHVFATMALQSNGNISNVAPCTFLLLLRHH